jgi:galactose mutarotase-like enzyme
MEHALHPQPGYPFSLALSVEYLLADDGLLVRTTATNRGPRPCPYGTGNHPYSSTAAALVGAGILSTAILPVVGLRLRAGAPKDDDPLQTQDGTAAAARA